MYVKGVIYRDELSATPQFHTALWSVSPSIKLIGFFSVFSAKWLG